MGPPTIIAREQNGATTINPLQVWQVAGIDRLQQNKSGLPYARQAFRDPRR